jgi:amino acid transporter
VGLQGVLSRSELKSTASAGTTLVMTAHLLGGGFWAKAMALAIALSVIATTGTGIVLGARLVYGMASYRALPGFLSNVSRRFATPVYASLLVGILIIVLSAVYYLVTSVQTAFGDVIAVTGFLFSIFYIMTAVAAMVYYRRRIYSSAWDFMVLGVLPLAAAGFLGWVLVKSLLNADAAWNWSLIGIVAVGLVMMVVARVGLRSPFFHIRRESDTQRG